MIFTRWLRSLRYGNPLVKKINSDDYYKNYHQFITNLLAKPDSLVRIAALSDDHDICLGFSVSREDVLDYIHVHSDYRKIGVGKALCPDGITTFSHITITGLMIWQRSKYKKLQFNPFA